MTRQQEADELLDLWRRQARRGIPPAERELPDVRAVEEIARARSAKARPQQ
jgi:hypothetical protein